MAAWSARRIGLAGGHHDEGHGTNPTRQPDPLGILDEWAAMAFHPPEALSASPRSWNQLSGNLSRSVSASWVICAVASSMTRSRSTPVLR